MCEFRRVARELGVPGPVTIQNSYSLVSRGVDSDLAEALFREKMSLLAYSPLAGGMLTGKYLGGAPPPELALHAVRRSAALPQADGARGGRGLRRAGAAARTHARAARARLRRSRWYVGASIIGATTLAQLDENIAAAQVELDAATLAEIAALQTRYPNPAG